MNRFIVQPGVMPSLNQSIFDYLTSKNVILSFQNEARIVEIRCDKDNPIDLISLNIVRLKICFPLLEVLELTGWNQGKLFDTFSCFNSMTEFLGHTIIFRNCHFTKIVNIYLLGPKLVFESCGKLSFASDILRVSELIVRPGHDVSWNLLEQDGDIFIEGCTILDFQLRYCVRGTFEIINSTFKGSLKVKIVEGEWSQNVRLTSGNKYEDHSVNSESGYRELKRLFEENKNTASEAYFYSHELQAKYLSRINFKDSMWYFSIVYLALSRMGRSILLPILWIFVSSILFTIVDTEIAKESICNYRVKINSDWLDLIMQSIFSPILLIALPKSDSDCVSLGVLIWFSFEKVWITFLYYLSILGIRRRFKLD